MYLFPGNTTAQLSSFLPQTTRLVRNHTEAAATHKQVLEAVSSSQQSPSQLKVSCTDAIQTTVPLPLDCWDVLEGSHNVSGVHRIQPVGSPEPILVHCDMDSDGGGWTVSTLVDSALAIYSQAGGKYTCPTGLVSVPIRQL